MKTRFFAASAFAVMSFSGAVQASDYATVYGGLFNINEHTNSSSEGLLGAEYRAKPWDYGIRPTVGAFVTAESDAYAYAGINWDITMAAPWVITPNFMAGLYHHGSGEDMGGAVEFKSGIEVQYTMSDNQRVGVAFNHMSNAGIYDHNPGAENVLVTYSLPLGQ